MGKTTYRPGEKAPKSGIYKPTDGGTEVAISQDDRFPPTTPGKGFTLKTPTKTGKK